LCSSHLSHWAWNKGSNSYLDLHLEIDSEGGLGTKLYDKRDDFNIPIVKFPFICSNIPTALSYGVYICQMIRYSSVCGSYHIGYKMLLTRKLLKQEFLLVMLKSSLRKCCGCHHDVVDGYEISVSQWPPICPICRKHFLVLSVFNSYNRVCS
jgi:hypothetical protein